MAYQINSILPAISNALRFGVACGDSELYLLAAEVFAQPAMGVQLTGGETPEESITKSSIFRMTTLEGLRTGTIETATRYSFAALPTISVSRLQDCLVSEETALVISGQPLNGRLSCLLVSRESVLAPRILTEWSADAFQNWISKYQARLYWSKPEQFVPGVDTLLPPILEIRNMFAELSLSPIEVSEKLTILPAAHLFGFAWNLAQANGTFLAERTSVAVAPSAVWLVAARTSSWKGRSQRKAWIGSAQSQDTTLIALREQARAALDEHGFSLATDAAPFDFRESEVVFIGAHGGTGLADYFRSVSDRRSHFAPTEFARMLGRCGCVILAVCSGGRSDRQTGSVETLGLVSALLREGVRSIIAPPWPLDIEVIGYWLPAFLAASREGKSVGESAVAARDAVRIHLDHPCAWGQLHVYGDQQFGISGSS